MTLPAYERQQGKKRELALSVASISTCQYLWDTVRPQRGVPGSLSLGDLRVQLETQLGTRDQLIYIKISLISKIKCAHLPETNKNCSFQLTVCTKEQVK
jgi:hypothetical protein